MSRLVVPLIGLTLIYALTLGSFDPVDLAMGAALSGLVAVSLRGRLPLGHDAPAASLASRIVWFPVFGLGVMWEVIVGTWDVSLRVLHLRPVDRPGIVRVPIGPRSERGVAVLALATTLSPGSVLVDVDRERGDVLLHVIDASDPDKVRDREQAFYDRYQRRVFP